MSTEAELFMCPKEQVFWKFWKLTKKVLLMKSVENKCADYIYFKIFQRHILELHCVESVEIRSYFWSVFNPNTGKYGPEITPYLDTFHAVLVTPSAPRILL